ncbi:methylmalonyl-CoA mutase family protein [Bacillus sp. FJAT-49736]|uniref:methylmalonyl-CoA mutase family protein n=1 Tax=Bacillus sp. FJAT-49736 TaxID=2833582 RepID=UPI001BCA4369|nr:methylmalonyl-CoA mutase family protein [Bacillus sp. FJAT-49736]MBS4173398.1 methylmalonyl-CoA mutase [Bacillus sp. FJAT-49736]
MKTNYTELKKQSFSSYTIDDWTVLAKGTLKNKPMDSLMTKTYEGITLKPLYVKEDLEFIHIDQDPGTHLRIRGYNAISNQLKPWRMAQNIKKRDWSEVKALLKNALASGQDCLSFDVDYLNNMVEVDFSEFKNTPMFLRTTEHFQTLIEKVLKGGQTETTGVIATDLISSKLNQGKINADDSYLLENWSLQILQAKQSLPNIKTILIDVTPYHNGGANAVQELAIALSEAVFYIEHMKNHGWNPEQTIQKLVFHFGIGGNFFMEIAKLRAFRAVFTTIEKAYDLSDIESVTVSAETSAFTKSVIDPYVNMLRAGNEAFAAILGGVEYLHVTPFDQVFQENDDFSARIARNTQLILKEEAHLNSAVDPAGGSYYVESLTNELIEKAWELFQKIDSIGGIIEVLRTGWLQSEINQVLNARLLDMETRKQSIIGTNVYANPSEKLLFVHSNHVKEAMDITPIYPVRIAQAYEKLRERAFDLEKKGIILCAGLICLGNLKEHKPRADFVTGVLATAGIKANWSTACKSIEDVKNYIQESNLPYYCFCGTDEMYEQYGSQIGEWMMEQYPSVRVEIAGKLTDDKMENFRNSGISDTIHLQQNMVEKLTSLLYLWEV